MFAANLIFLSALKMPTFDRIIITICVSWPAWPLPRFYNAEYKSCFYIQISRRSRRPITRFGGVMPTKLLRVATKLLTRNLEEIFRSSLDQPKLFETLESELKNTVSENGS